MSEFTLEDEAPRHGEVDLPRIEAAVREILLAVGEDPDREGLVETPKRVANMYEEIFAGLTEDPKQHIKLFNEQSNDEMVIVKDIPFYSMCEHHLLPFFGKAHIGYIPSDNKIIGLSKLARIVDNFAKYTIVHFFSHFLIKFNTLYKC